MLKKEKKLECGLLGIEQEHQATRLQHKCRGPDSDTYMLQDCPLRLCEPLGAQLS